jgi:hypothetical protein
MVDLNALLTPSMSNMTSPLPMSIALTILRNDLPRMSGDEVDLLSILEVEFLGGSDDVRPPPLDLVLHVTFACKIFLDYPQNICFFVGDVAVHLRLGLVINKIYTKAKKKTRVKQNPRLIFLFCFEDDQN